MIIRRLVLTGNDTPDNLLKFFGLYPTDEGEIKEYHYEALLEVLLKPPMGSYYYAMATSHRMDEGCPTQTPREAEEEEEEDLEMIRELQGCIRRHMFSRRRSMRSIDHDDMEDILTDTLGTDWESGKREYLYALNSIDLGYPEGYNPCKHRDDIRTQRHYHENCD